MADKSNLKYTGNVFTPRFATALTSATLNQPLWLNLSYPPPPVFTNHSAFPQYQVSEWVPGLDPSSQLPATQECALQGAEITKRLRLPVFFTVACFTHGHVGMHTHTHALLNFPLSESQLNYAVYSRSAPGTGRWLVLGLR